MEGDDEPGGGGGRIATYTEIGIAEDIHEISVGDIASKVAEDDAVLDGVVDGGSFPIAAWAMGESAQLIRRGCKPRRGRISHHLYPSSICSRPLVRTPSG